MGRRGHAGADASKSAVTAALEELSGAARLSGHVVREDAQAALICWAERVIGWRTAAQLTSAASVAEVIGELMVPAVYALVVLDVSRESVVVDLGSGNGATGVALALVASGGQWVLVDRSTKKVTFCRYALHSCRIDRAQAVGLEEWLALGVRADAVLWRGLPANTATLRTVGQVAGGAGKVVRWMAGDERPAGERVVRCGDRPLWVVVGDVECFT